MEGTPQKGPHVPTIRKKVHGRAAIPNVIVKDEEIFVAISSGA